MVAKTNDCYRPLQKVTRR